jgi:hypothetical protein
MNVPDEGLFQTSYIFQWVDASAGDEIYNLANLCLNKNVDIKFSAHGALLE